MSSMSILKKNTRIYNCFYNEIDKKCYNLSNNSIMNSDPDPKFKCKYVNKKCELLDEPIQKTIRVKFAIDNPGVTVGGKNNVKKLTQKKVKYNNKFYNVYKGPKGGEYIKSNNKFINIKNI